MPPRPSPRQRDYPNRVMKLTEFFATIGPFLEGRVTQHEAALSLYGAGHARTDAKRLALYQVPPPMAVLDGVFRHLKSAVITLVGKDAWENLGRDYFRAYPMRHFELNRNGVHLPQFLESYESRARLPGWLSELADFEWWEWHTLMEPDDPSDTTPDTGTLRLGATVELRPYHYDFVQWPAPSDAALTPPEARQTIVMFWRDRGLKMRRRIADRLDFELLRRAHRSEPITPFTLQDPDVSWQDVENRIALLHQTGVFRGELKSEVLQDAAMVKLSPEELKLVARCTTQSYDAQAMAYKNSALSHDLSQNHAALLENIVGRAPLQILDLGCGPGRDLMYFRSQGHLAIGLDGSRQFVQMARAYSGCEVLHQDILALNLPAESFDGIFANASLFHVPTQELPQVLGKLWSALKPGGTLFSSNPLGKNQEGWLNDRYGAFLDLERWTQILHSAGFTIMAHYYRPPDLPEAEQSWLATVWRRRAT